jgi:hypothetical protein
MSGYIAFHVDDYREDGVPVATGATRLEAQAKAIRRVLGLGLTSGGISTQPNRDLNPADFQTLTETLDKYFAERLPA